MAKKRTLRKVDSSLHDPGNELLHRLHTHRFQGRKATPRIETPKDRHRRPIVPGCIVLHTQDYRAGVVTQAIGYAVTIRRLTDGDSARNYGVDQQIYDAVSPDDLIVYQTPDMSKQLLLPPATTAVDLINRCLEAMAQIDNDLTYLLHLDTPLKLETEDLSNREMLVDSRRMKRYLDELLNMAYSQAKMREVDIVADHATHVKAAAKKLKLKSKKAA